MSILRIGLIGAGGWMGRTHALMYRAQDVVFGPEPARVVLDMVCEPSNDRAQTASSALGANRWTVNWRDLVTDPQIDIVDIVTPNNLHCDMALAAIEAGKHVYCEKPLAISAEESRQMAEAARRRGVLTLVGFNYPHNPIHAVARDLVNNGSLGSLISVQGSKIGDALADPSAPFSWRCDRAIAGSGALGDTAAHIFSLTEYIAGPITALCGQLGTIHGQRADHDGTMRPVDTDDTVHALCRFADGASGTIEASRVSPGWKQEFSYRIVGTKGSIAWSQDRLNELKVFETGSGQGFTTIKAGPEHPPYGRFFPAAGFGMGYHDHKMIEVRQLVVAAATGRGELWPDFGVGHRIQCYLDAIISSSETQSWVDVQG